MLLGAAGLEQSSGPGQRFPPEVNFGFGNKLYVNAGPDEQQAGITRCQRYEHLQEKVRRSEVRLEKQTLTFDSRNMNSLGRRMKQCFLVLKMQYTKMDDRGVIMF